MKVTATLLFLMIICFSSCKSSDKKMQGPKGEYRVETLGNDSVVDKQMTMRFNPEKGQISGSGVCNSYSSTYVVSVDNIKFSPAMATKMMCPEGTSLEYNFFQVLVKADNFKLRRGILSLYNAEDELILTAKDQ